MTKEKIEAQLANYRQGRQQLAANLQATDGAIQALENLLKDWEGENKDDKAKPDTKRT